jgi:hypothetical protein
MKDALNLPEQSLESTDPSSDLSTDVKSSEHVSISSPKRSIYVLSPSDLVQIGASPQSEARRHLSSARWKSTKRLGFVNKFPI